MPLNDFFSYSLERHDAGIITGKVTINGSHPLFKGHFPSQPVTPGVVLIEIFRQVLSSTLNKNFMLREAREIKFLVAVIPTDITELVLTIEYTISQKLTTASCILSGNGQVFTKLKGDFSEQ
jgi:3-hydroxyacyl-[acyl-carrier-protein] dehydratase